MRTDRAGLGLLLAIVSAATFGTSGTFARALLESGWTPGAAVAVRVGVAALVLAVPAIWSLRGRWGVARRAAGAVGSFGLLAVAGTQLAFFNAVQYLPVGVALLLEYSGILLVVLWMWARHGQRPQRLTVAGAAVALVGLALVLNLTGQSDVDPLGLIWGLVAAAGLAAYFVLSARVDPEFPSVALACGGMAFGAILLLAFGAIGLLPLRFSTADVSFAGHQTGWWVPVAGLSLVAAVIAYVCGIAGARILGASLSSFVGLTEVLFAVGFAWLALGELPTAIQGIGGAFIVAGIALVRADSLRSGQTPPSLEPAVASQAVSVGADAKK